MLVFKLLVLFLFGNFIISSVLGTGSGHLTPEKNAELQSTCGKKKLPEGSIRRKSFGGVELNVNEAPWSTLIWNDETICSGTLISSRHILTAAHCVVQNPEKRFVTQQIIKLGSHCNKFEECRSSPSSPYYIATATFPSFYLSTLHVLDIAILELDRSVPDSEATPLCIARKDTKLDKFIFGVGYGNDVSKSVLGTLQSYNMTFKSEDAPVILYESINYTQMIDSGDSGSGGLQIREDRGYEIVGVLVGSNRDVGSVFRKENGGLAIYSDVRRFSDWICIYSGVCPDKSRRELYEYLLFYPEASVNKMDTKDLIVVETVLNQCGNQMMIKTDNKTVSEPIQEPTHESANKVTAEPTKMYAKGTTNEPTNGSNSTTPEPTVSTTTTPATKAVKVL